MKAGAAMSFTRYGAIGKSKELKPGQRCIFFKGGGDGGEKKTVKPPSDDFLLDLADWLLGCHGCTSITVKFGQSGVKAELSASLFFFKKYNINILTFFFFFASFLQTFLAAPRSFCLLFRERLVSLCCDVVKGHSDETPPSLASPRPASHSKITPHPGMISSANTQ